MEAYKNLNLQNLENEIWKVIKEYPDYQVSNLGRVKSFKNNCGIGVKNIKTI